MKRHAAVLALLLLSAPLLPAQTLRFGEPFALTNTRYDTAIAHPDVETNGRDFFLFWQTENNLRVTKLVEGEQRGGRHVLANGANANASVAWTGTHFFVASTMRGGIAGQVLDANAEPVGVPFALAGDLAVKPVVASNGRTVLLLYADTSTLHAVALTPGGAKTGISSTVIPAGTRFSSHDVASNGTGFAAVVSTQSGVVALTYDGDGRELSRTFAYLGARPVEAGNVAIATDGRDYLAAWQLPEGRAEVARVSADGSARNPLMIEPATDDGSFASPPRIAWTGTNWAVAYTKAKDGGADPRLRVAYVHPRLPQVVGYDDAGPGFSPALASADGRVMMTWRPNLLGAPAVVSLLPLAEQEPEPATFAAGGQEPIAVASALDATLAVWKEIEGGVAALHAGVRSADGNWVEREIAGQSTGDALAASDGIDFVLITGAFARFVDASSRVTAGPIRLPFSPKSIAWTGTDYLIADHWSIARLGRSGSVSVPVSLESFGAMQAIASNGTATVAVFTHPTNCPFLCPGIYGRLKFAPLGADLRPVGQPQFISATEDVSDNAQVVWEGTRFLATWGERGFVNVAELPADGGEPEIVATFPSVVWGRLHMVAAQGGVALTWRELLEGPDGLNRTRVATVRNDNRTSIVEFDNHTNWTKPMGFVAALQNGRIAHLSAEPRYDAPHHGSSRIIMRVSGALRAKPEPPRLSGEIRKGHVELAWSAPSQDIDGYRLEYRVGDGSWNEFERWIDADEDAITVLWPLRQGVPYQFRLRAFNDAGASDYSAPVFFNVPKRRSVR
jgi:hypothetical protein